LEAKIELQRNDGSSQARGDKPPTNGPTSRLRVLHRLKPFMGYGHSSSTAFSASFKD